MTENFGDDTFRTVLLIPVVHDFYNDLMAVHRMHILSLWDIDVFQDTLVVRLDEADGLVLMIEADDFLVCVLQNLCDMSLGTMARIGITGDDHAYTVTIERYADIIGRDKDVRLIFVPFHRYEAEATRMRMEGADMCEVLRSTIFSLLGNADTSL